MDHVTMTYTSGKCAVAMRQAGLKHKDPVCVQVQISFLALAIGPVRLVFHYDVIGCRLPYMH